MIVSRPELLHSKFDVALPYAEFVASCEADGHRGKWDQRYGQLELDTGQAAVVAGFTRRVHVLCLTGSWCGDCALQGAAMQRVAEGNPGLIDLRFLQREEEHADLIVKATINQGFRVPVTWFMAEDFVPVSAFGDRTLSRYRSMARKALGEAANVYAEAPADPVRAVLSEVLDEFERVQLVLRLSTRLRAKHGD